MKKWKSWTLRMAMLLGALGSQACFYLNEQVSYFPSLPPKSGVQISQIRYLESRDSSKIWLQLHVPKALRRNIDSSGLGSGYLMLDLWKGTSKVLINLEGEEMNHKLGGYERSGITNKFFWNDAQDSSETMDFIVSIPKGASSKLRNGVWLLLGGPEAKDTICAWNQPVDTLPYPDFPSTFTADTSRSWLGIEISKHQVGNANSYYQLNYSALYNDERRDWLNQNQGVNGTRLFYARTTIRRKDTVLSQFRHWFLGSSKQVIDGYYGEKIMLTSDSVKNLPVGTFLNLSVDLCGQSACMGMVQDFVVQL